MCIGTPFEILRDIKNNSNPDFKKLNSVSIQNIVLILYFDIIHNRNKYSEEDINYFYNYMDKYYTTIYNNRHAMCEPNLLLLTVMILFIDPIVIKEPIYETVIEKEKTNKTFLFKFNHYKLDRIKQNFSNLMIQHFTIWANKNNYNCIEELDNIYIFINSVSDKYNKYNKEIEEIEEDKKYKEIYKDTDKISFIFNKYNECGNMFDGYKL